MVVPEKTVVGDSSKNHVPVKFTVTGSALSYIFVLALG
jgi:hypothetical protein